MAQDRQDKKESAQSLQSVMAARATGVEGLQPYFLARFAKTYGIIGPSGPRVIMSRGGADACGKHERAVYAPGSCPLNGVIATPGFSLHTWTRGYFHHDALNLAHVQQAKALGQYMAMSLM